MIIVYYTPNGKAKKEIKEHFMSLKDDDSSWVEIDPKSIVVLEEDIKKEPELSESRLQINISINYSCMLSDIGTNVFLSYSDELIQALIERNCGALLIYPSVDAYKEYTTKSHKAFKLTDVERLARLHIISSISSSIKGHEFNSFDDKPLSRLHCLSSEFFKHNRSLETLLWGLKYGSDKELSETDVTVTSSNVVELCEEKETGIYYLTISSALFQESADVVLSTLNDIETKLKRWCYLPAQKIRLDLDERLSENDEDESHVQKIISDSNVISAKTLPDLLINLAILSLMHLFKDENCTTDDVEKECCEELDKEESTYSTYIDEINHYLEESKKYLDTAMNILASINK